MTRLICPVARHEAREEISATRPPSLVGAAVALVDSMQNPRGMWGQGLLDMAGQAILERVPSAAFVRVDRQNASSPPETWAAQMAERQLEAIVIAAGD